MLGLRRFVWCTLVDNIDQYFLLVTVSAIFLQLKQNFTGGINFRNDILRSIIFEYI